MRDGEPGGQTGRFLIFISVARNDRSLESGELPVCPHLSNLEENCPAEPTVILIRNL